MKVLLSLSGGLDSTTLLAWLLDQGHEVEGVCFDYGSKHNQFEIESVFPITAFYRIRLQILNLKHAFLGFESNLLLGGDEIPEGHYNDETMKQTVVPCRNIIFISLLSGLAESKGMNAVALAIHSGDHAIYPDCRPSFYYAMKDAINEGTDKKISLMAPFLNIDKAEIVRRGLVLNVPYELTRTCYKHQRIACSKCGSCRERLEAFELNNTTD